MRDDHGRCISLEDNDFGGKPCPFHKTVAERDAGGEQSYQRLVAMGRFDLIAKYHLDEQRKAKVRRKQHEPD